MIQEIVRVRSMEQSADIIVVFLFRHCNSGSNKIMTEVNLVSWNGAKAKIDIHGWSLKYEKR